MNIVHSRTLMIASGLAAALLAGCMPKATVENIRHAPVAAGVDGISERAVAEAIQRGGARTGWILAVDGKNRYLAVRREGRRKAEVAIEYNTHQYGIRYRDSQGFDHHWRPVADYGGAIINNERGRIHPAYNEWVRKLDAAIQAELGAAR